MASPRPLLSMEAITIYGPLASPSRKIVPCHQCSILRLSLHFSATQGRQRVKYRRIPLCTLLSSNLSSTVNAVGNSLRSSEEATVLLPFR